MGLSKQHEIHKRRFSRNAGLGVALGTFVVLVFALTMAKLKDGGSIEGFDYQVAPKFVETPE